jgi:hypothetical protein
MLTYRVVAGRAPNLFRRKTERGIDHNNRSAVLYLLIRGLCATRRRVCSEVCGAKHDVDIASMAIGRSVDARAKA